MVAHLLIGSLCVMGWHAMVYIWDKWINSTSIVIERSKVIRGKAEYYFHLVYNA